MAYCSECGAQLAAGARFCAACGTAVNLTDRPAPQIPRTRKIAIIVGTICLVGAFGGYLYSTPYLAVKQFKSSIEAGRYDDLRDLIDFNALRTSVQSTLHDGLQRLGQELADADPKMKGDAGALSRAYTTTGVERAVNEAIRPESLADFETRARGIVDLLGNLPGGSKTKADLNSFRKLISEKTVVTTGYSAFETFEIRFRVANIDGRATAVFHRAGLFGWKLSGVEMGAALPWLLRRGGLTKSENEIAEALTTRQDYTAALKWANLGSAWGDSDAMVTLARLHGGGRGTKHDVPEALKWIRKAAEQGNPNASWHLGDAYRYGISVKRDVREALKLYEKSREYFTIAEIYWHGKEVPADLELAKKWYQEEVSSGTETVAGPGSIKEQAKRRLTEIQEAIASGKGANYEPPWLKLIRGSEVKPGIGLGGILIGAPDAEAIKLLGEPWLNGPSYGRRPDGSPLGYHLQWDWKGTSLLIFSTPSRTIRSILAGELDWERTFPSTGNQVTLGTLPSRLDSLGQPTRSSGVYCGRLGVTIFHTAEETKKLSAGTKYMFSGLGVIRCDHESSVISVCVGGVERADCWRSP